VVALHEEVGPARTTVVEIADRAQVSRPTVYSHFPDERSLITACSQHWSLANPRPDTATWKQIADPRMRLRTALEQLYDYYSPRERMLANVIRDSELIPSLSEALQHTMGPYSRPRRRRFRPELGNATSGSNSPSSSLHSTFTPGRH